MGIFGKKQRYGKGFTIVEVIVVISVIGILASIVLVAYPNYQKASRDSQRKSDLEQITAALRTYAFQENSYITDGSGCGQGGDGNGWLSAGPSDISSYPKSIVGCLQDIRALSADVPFIDPSDCIYDSGGDCGSSGGGAVRAYMKATCEKNGEPKTYVFAHLETEPRKDTEIDELCDSGSVNGFDASSQRWGTNYGMNYYVSVH